MLQVCIAAKNADKMAFVYVHGSENRLSLFGKDFVIVSTDR